MKLMTFILATLLGTQAFANEICAKKAQKIASAVLMADLGELDAGTKIIDTEAVQTGVREGIVGTIRSYRVNINTGDKFDSRFKVDVMESGPSACYLVSAEQLFE